MRRDIRSASRRWAGAALAATLAIGVAVIPSAPAAFATNSKATVFDPVNIGTVFSSPDEPPPDGPHHVTYGGDYSFDTETSMTKQHVYARIGNATGPIALSVAAPPSPACASNLFAHGGNKIILNVSVNGIRVGTVTYAHLTNFQYASGDPVPVGAWIGDTVTAADGVKKFIKSNGDYCWGGPHVHVEPGNTTQAGCYVAGILHHANNGSVALGVVGGEFATGLRQPCPAGATASSSANVGAGSTDPAPWKAAWTASLGTPADNVHTVGSLGCIQTFTGGDLGPAALMQRNCTGAVYPVTGAHWAKVNQIGIPTVGFPTDASHRWGPSWTQDFGGGTWNWNVLMVTDRDNSKAFVVRNAMWAQYRAQGGATGGQLGVPMGDEFVDGGVARQDFYNATALTKWQSLFYEIGAPAADIGVAPAAAPAGSSTRFLNIVVLGDSYSAGNGAEAPAPDDCYRSAFNIGGLLWFAAPAARRGFYVNQACTGNVVGNLDGQMAAVSATHKKMASLVLVSMGGNDAQFADIVEQCLVGITDNAAKCKFLLDTARSSLPIIMEEARRKMLNILATFPNARVVLVGYPLLVDYSRISDVLNPGAIRTVREVRELGLRAEALQNRMIAGIGPRASYVPRVNLFSRHEVNAATSWMVGIDPLSWPKLAFYHPNPTGWAASAGLIKSLGYYNSLPPSPVGDMAADYPAWEQAWNPSLGRPINHVHIWGPGCIQDLRGGTLGDAALMQLGCKGPVYAVTGAHWARVARLGSSTVGFPTNNSHRWGASWAQDFDGGSWGWNNILVPDNNNTKAFVVRSGIWALYRLAGGAVGAYGVPKGDEFLPFAGIDSVAQQQFVGGTVTWKRFAVGSGSTDKPAWLSAWDAGLGYPINAVHTWGAGCIQDFRGGALGDAALMQKNCTGPVYAVTGAHWFRVVRIGPATIGYPINNSHRWGSTWTQDFSGGSWGWNVLMVPDHKNTQAFVVRSAIWAKYRAAGGAGGSYGAPNGDEFDLVAGTVARQSFTGGNVTWSRFAAGDGSTSAATFKAAWHESLGYPMNAVHRWGVGCIQDLRGGALGDAALMQKNCTGPVYEVTGAHWYKVARTDPAAMGYPTNNSHRWGLTWIQDFGGGSWGWNALIIPDIRNTQAFEVRTGFWETYRAANGPLGAWGVPLSDEYNVPVGAKQNFSGGTMTYRAVSDRLAPGQVLTANKYIVSADERYTLVMQGDGNLVQYGPGGAVWSSGTVGISAPRVVMQQDGNLVIYDGANNARWSSGTLAFPLSSLVLQSDSNLVIYSPKRGAVWTRGSGKLVLPDPTGVIAIRSTLNNTYWSAQIDYAGSWNGAVRAAQPAIGSWEQFQLIGNCRSAEGCGIWSLASGHYLSAELNYVGTAELMVRARAATSPAGGWERFQLVGDCQSVGGCAFKSVANGRYLMADFWTGFAHTDAQWSLMRARSTAIGGWESFRIYDL